MASKRLLRRALAVAREGDDAQQLGLVGARRRLERLRDVRQPRDVVVRLAEGAARPDHLVADERPPPLRVRPQVKRRNVLEAVLAHQVGRVGPIGMY